MQVSVRFNNQGHLMSGEAPVYLTTKELADLLRIKERKVYDLAASGKVPCSRATGKLLFPAAEIRAWIETSRSCPASGATCGRSS